MDAAVRPRPGLRDIRPLTAARGNLPSSWSLMQSGSAQGADGRAGTSPMRLWQLNNPQHAPGLDGEDRLRADFAKLAPLTAKQAGERILESVDAFIGATRPYDDLSLVILRRT